MDNNTNTTTTKTVSDLRRAALAALAAGRVRRIAVTFALASLLVGCGARSTGPTVPRLLHVSTISGCYYAGAAVKSERQYEAERPQGLDYSAACVDAFALGAAASVPRSDDGLQSMLEQDASAAIDAVGSEVWDWCSLHSSECARAHGF